MKYEYTDNNIEWIGKYPKHWKVNRIIQRVEKVVGGEWGSDPDGDETEDTKNIVVLRVQDFSDTYLNYEELTIRKVKLSKIPHRLITGNCLLMEKSGGGEKQLVGRVVLPKDIPVEAICSNFVAKIEFDTKVDVAFMNYVFNDLYSHNMNFPFVQQTTGIQNINSTYYLYTKIPFPPKHEQTAITNYLDKVCAEIDRVVEIKKIQIDNLQQQLKTNISELFAKGNHKELKSTDSLVIPKIPKHWELKKLKRVLAEKLKYGATESGDLDNPYDPRYIRITDFSDDGSLRDDTFKSLPNEVAKDYMLSEGDVLFARSGATVGKTFMFKNYKGEACYAGYLIKAVTQRYKMFPEFLYYYTKTKMYEDWKNIIFTQATIQNIGADKYQYLPIPVPPIKEQKKILETTELLLEKTKSAQSKIEKQIETILDYKKALIHEVVTGKKQVYGLEKEKLKPQTATA